MSQTHTIVVRFPAGIVPRYSAATEFQGGQVVAVDFDGNRLHVCQQLEEALEACLELIDTISPLEGDVVRKTRAALELARSAPAKARGDSS
ncbi:hypothetical protein [Vreelandella aquamarina]|uniref:hypothetical protein n=1 Tax=Vreelandella aquamarina TaxID=77097 RepID=UPI000785D342|nr:hypothetical protein [Halomonas axialensis]